MSDQESFANWLYRNRVKHFGTQVALARYLDVGAASVCQWETGQVYPRKAMITRLEQAFDYANGAPEADDPSPETGEAAPYGAWVEQTRISKGWSPSDLAERAGVTPATIYNIEAGRVSNPQAATKERISVALEVELPGEVESEIEEENSAGEFGQLYDFSPRYGEAPVAAGVYVFYDISGRPVYVGIAANIQERMRQHEHADRWFVSQEIVAKARYIPIETERERRSIEKLLIKFLGKSAILNRQHREK